MINLTLTGIIVMLSCAVGAMYMQDRKVNKEDVWTECLTHFNKSTCTYIFDKRVATNATIKRR